MGGLQGRDDALQLAEQLQGIEGLRIRDGAVLGPADGLEIAVLRAHTGVIQAGTDGVRLLHLPLLVLEQQAHRPVQHAYATLGNGGGMATGGNAIAGRFHADQADVGVLDKGVEQTHGIGAPTNAGHQDIGVTAKGLMALALGLLADHGMEIAHQHREGMGACDGTQDVVGRLDVGDPIADRLTGGVLQGGGASGDGLNRCPQQTHPEDVQGLTAHVLGAHVDDALEAKARTDRGGGHTVLARTGFGNDPLFAHPQGQECLAQGVVDLVGAGVIEVFALQPNARAALGAAVVLAQPFRFVEGVRPADVVAQQVIEPLRERGILPGFCSGPLQFRQGGDQGLGNVLTAKLAVATQAVGP